MSTFLLTVVTHTPLWVWGLLALLVWAGLRQSVTHRVSRGRLWLQPLVLGGWSLASAGGAFVGTIGIVAVLCWLAGAALGMLANRVLGLPREVQALPDGAAQVGGSWAPLALLLSIFLIRYVIAASMAVVPALAALPVFAAVACTLYGLPAGLFLARALKIRAALAGVAAAPTASPLAA